MSLSNSLPVILKKAASLSVEPSNASVDSKIDNPLSTNTTSGLSLILPTTPGANIISTIKGITLSQLASKMAAEFGIPQYAASLVSEYALHCIEKALSPNGIVRPAVEQRMNAIRNERFPQRGLSTQILDVVENLVNTNKATLENSGLESKEAQTKLVIDEIIKPSIQFVNAFLPLLGLTVSASLNGTFQALDLLKYGFGSDGPALERQYGTGSNRNGRNSRSEQPLASRSGSRMGRQDREFSGSIDCSGYVLQAIRAIAVDVMVQKGASLDSAIRQAKANVPDINTAIMRDLARRDRIGGLRQCPSAEEMRAAYREGRIEIGDALVVGPRRGRQYGHTGILALNKDGRLVVHESMSGAGVVERSLESWAALGNQRGGLLIFRHPYLKKLGIFEGKPIPTN